MDACRGAVKWIEDAITKQVIQPHERYTGRPVVVRLREIPCQQQTGGTDCGLFTALFDSQVSAFLHNALEGGGPLHMDGVTALLNGCAWDQGAERARLEAYIGKVIGKGTDGKKTWLPADPLRPLAGSHDSDKSWASPPKTLALDLKIHSTSFMYTGTVRGGRVYYVTPINPGTHIRAIVCYASLHVFNTPCVHFRR